MSERPNVLIRYECPHCGQAVSGSYNIDSERERCSKKWHKGMVRKREYILARAVIDCPEALDAAQDALPGHARSLIRSALLDAMRAAADAGDPPKVATA